MSELSLKAGQEELFEMARAILEALDRREIKKDPTESLDLYNHEIYSKTLENGHELFERKDAEIGGGEYIRGVRDWEFESGISESIKKLMENKSERKQVGIPESTGGMTLFGEGSVQAKKAAVRNQEFEQSGIPERVSELFCRDARRYDGAFERY